MPPPSITRRPGAAGAGMKLGLVVGLIVLLLGGIGGATWWARTNRVAIDPDTLCPEQGPSAIHAILIDRSDPLTPLQQARVRQRIDEIVESAPVGGRVAIYLAESDGVEALPPALALCNPGAMRTRCTRIPAGCANATSRLSEIASTRCWPA